MFVKFTAVLGRDRDRQTERQILETTQGNTGHVLGCS